MFTVDPNITDFKPSVKDLYKVLFSMNVHQVATPEMSVEEARSYVFFLRRGDQSEVYFSLYFLNSDRRLYYTHSSNPFSRETAADIESEARGFAEDLGALLDEIDFSRLTSSEKDRWIKEHEILPGRKREVEKLPDASADSEPLELAAGQISSEDLFPTGSSAARETSDVVEPGPVAQSPSAAKLQPPASGPAPVVPASVHTQETPQKTARQRKMKDSPAEEKKQAEAADIPPAPSNPGFSPQAEQVLEEALTAGVVKTPKTQFKKAIRSATGVVSRNKEALARLMASF